MQETAYEMRMSDWSSDVCSSDLEEGQQEAGRQPAPVIADEGDVFPNCASHAGLIGPKAAPRKGSRLSPTEIRHYRPDLATVHRCVDTARSKRSAWQD